MRWARVPAGRVVAVGCVSVKTVCSVSAAAVLPVISNSPFEYLSKSTLTHLPLPSPTYPYPYPPTPTLTPVLH